MLEAIIYAGFFWILVGEVVFFAILNLPTPKGSKGRIVNFLATNRIIGYVLLAHLGCCIIAAFFYWDLHHEEVFYSAEKDKLRMDAQRHIGTGKHGLT